MSVLSCFLYMKQHGPPVFHLQESKDPCISMFIALVFTISFVQLTLGENAWV